jgi:hypothetical protein
MTFTFEELLKLLTVLTPLVTGYLVYLNRKQSKQQALYKDELAATDQAIRTVKLANDELRKELIRAVRERESLRTVVLRLEGAIDEQRKSHNTELTAAIETISQLRSRVAELERMIK